MAKRFRFRLETVLEVRRQAQQAQQRVLALAVQEAVGLENRVAQVDGLQRQTLDQLRVDQTGPRLNVVGLRQRHYFRGGLQRVLDELKMDLERRRDVVRGEREKLAQARKRFRVIENLRNRQWSRHLAERTKAERIQMDEAALRFYLESRRAGRSLGEA